MRVNILDKNGNKRQRRVAEGIVNFGKQRSAAPEFARWKVCKQASFASAPLTIQPGYTILTRCVQGTNALAE